MNCSSLSSSVHGLSRQEDGSGLPFPPPRDLPNTGIEPVSLVSPALQTGSLPLHHLGAWLSITIFICPRSTHSWGLSSEAQHVMLSGGRQV